MNVSSSSSFRAKALVLPLSWKVGLTLKEPFSSETMKSMTTKQRDNGVS